MSAVDIDIVDQFDSATDKLDLSYLLTAMSAICFNRGEYQLAHKISELRRNYEKDSQ